MSDVLFVSMPFGPAFTPSIGLSLLQAELARAGTSSHILYFSLRFAERIGTRLYTQISQSMGIPIVNLAGEWIFAKALLEPAADDGAGYVDDILDPRSDWVARNALTPLSADTRRRIVRARDLVIPFIDACVEDVASRKPRLVGLTSSFQQHAASLAFAKRLKSRLPGVAVVMGGSNCEGVMGVETVRQFPFVDAVVSGEADAIIVDLVSRLRAGQSVDDLPGVRTPASVQRDVAAVRFSNAPMIRDLDALPYPDYRDFVRQFESTRLARDWMPNMLFESSRGCWWGEKAHCTFCGLNGSTMTYRSKRADRVLAELTHLARAYPGSTVQVVDNILEMGYFSDLLPQLARSPLKLDLFYETKANLKKDQIRQLRAARVTSIQPGIESFSDPVLTLMRKGVSWLQNVQLLKWCKQFGVAPMWNVLTGFPGEPAEEYARMARVVPRLTHLPAPVGGALIRLDRFSPNYEQADRFGFAHVRPLDPYRYIFPGLPEDALANLAYYFSFDYADGRDVQSYVRPLVEELKRWRRVYRRSELVSQRRRNQLAIVDLRPSVRERVTVLEPLDRALYEACDGVVHLNRLAQIAGSDVDAARARLAPLVDRGLLVTDGQRYLALAIPLEEYRPPASAMARIRRLLTERPHERSPKEQSWQRRPPRKRRSRARSRRSA